MSLKYRPEIDGLRAIAVISVVLYHAEFALNGRNPFSGGFIGVDIFFVISGYLITSIILRELKQTNSFSFANFYERRARRILHAIFAVMLFSLPLAWLYMLPKALKEYSGSVLSSLFFASNFWFWQENSYTAEASQLQPFLHTWTLSLEEQFYLIFPIILIALWKYARAWLMPIFIIGSLLSLQLAHYGSAAFPETSFYLLPSRGWELLAGSILALLGLRQAQGHNRYRFLYTIMPPIGLFMIGLPIFMFEDTMRHPSYITAFPILGTMALLYYMRESGWVTRLLSTKAFVAVGLISYSLYLWHFPIFAFARISLGDLAFPDKLILIGISVIIATAAYHLIEEPARRSKTLAQKPFTVLASSCFLLLISLNFLFFSGKLVPSKFVGLDQAIDFQYAYQEPFREGSCFLSPKNMMEDDPFQACEIIGYSDNKPTLFLWGDSHAAHLFSGYDATFGKQFNIVQRTSSMCAPIIGREVPARPRCKSINDDVLEEIISSQPDRVVLSAAWWVGSPMHTKATIEALRENGIANIYIVGPVPQWSNGLPYQLSQYVSANGEIPKYIDLGLQKAVFEVDREWVDFALENQLSYGSVLQILCREQKCLTRVGSDADAITQWDAAHLTAKGSQYLVKRLPKP